MKRIAMSLMDLVLSWKEKSIRTGYGHVIYFIWAVTFVTLCVFLLSTLALEWLLSNNVVSWHFVSEKKALYGAAGVNNFWSDFLIRFSDARLFHAMPEQGAQFGFSLAQLAKPTLYRQVVELRI